MTRKQEYSNHAHTPGPWVKAGRGDGTGQLPIRANGKIIAAVRDHGSLADAQLIAAAPDLWEALRDLQWAAWEAECKNPSFALDDAIRN